uniref:Granzyme B(G,H)-like n=1 Tax=Sinocyclocheilus grahami TaxID=75366 RepID=A0A672SVE6_SINGR
IQPNKCKILIMITGGLESGIVGGKEVKPHSRPYMASLQYRRQHTCGGMLIRDDYVLTSGHCLNPLFCDSKLIGMAAYTYIDDCTSKKYPGVYMKISAFLPWIKKILTTKRQTD